MNILIADKLADDVIAALKETGCEVDVDADLSAEDLPVNISGYNVLVVRSTKVTADTISAADSLSLIVRAGAGVNTIDVAAASQRGIYVSNCPGRNSDAVAELAIGLLIACDRQIVDATADLRTGQWHKKKFSQAHGLKGRTLGILGMGMIGRAVARRAAGLEMRVLAWSRSLTPDRAAELGVDYAESPLALAAASDAVSVHLAATAKTTHLIDATFLNTMREGAILVNTSRGEIVDTAAVKRAEHLRFGLDVFEQEPAGGQAEFADTHLANRITCTPHIGASTAQASDAIANEVVRIVQVFRATGLPPNTVNLCARTPATHSLVVRHYNRVGVLASVLDSLREEDVNVEEMQNTIFDGASAACCTLLLDQPPSAELLETLSKLDHILQVQLDKR